MRFINFMLIFMLLIGSVFGYSIDQLKKDNTVFSVELDANTAYLQPLSKDKFMLKVNLRSYELIKFNFYINDFEDVKAKTIKTISARDSFSIPIDVFVSKEALPATYPIEITIIGKGKYKTFVEKKIININVIEKQSYRYETSNHNQLMPKVIGNFKDNFLLELNKPESFIVELQNKGANSNFELKLLPEINGLNLVCDKKNILLVSNVKNYIVCNIFVDENFKTDYAYSYLFAEDNLTGMQHKLGRINVVLLKENLLVNFKKKNNNLIVNIENKGNLDSKLIVKGESEFVIYVPAKSKKEIALPLQNIEILKDNNVIAEYSLDGKLKTKDLGITALFSLHTDDNSVVFGLIIVIVLMVIYLLFFSKKKILSNTVSAKELGFKL